MKGKTLKSAPIGGFSEFSLRALKAKVYSLVSRELRKLGDIEVLRRDGFSHDLDHGRQNRHDERHRKRFCARGRDNDASSGFKE
jgi:hypothetical protein